MGERDDVEELINSIPRGGEWWSADVGDTYVELAYRLIDQGVKKQEAYDILEEAYYAAAREFGD